MLIRANRDNKPTTAGLLANQEAKKSLLDHAGRGEWKYKAIAKTCSQGYITVLPATLTLRGESCK